MQARVPPDDQVTQAIAVAGIHRIREVGTPGEAVRIARREAPFNVVEEGGVTAGVRAEVPAGEATAGAEAVGAQAGLNSPRGQT